MTEPDRIQKLREILLTDPGSEEFAELARLLADTPETRVEARELCFRGLTANPSNNLGRLVLARLFYLDGMFSFSVRELLEIQKLNPHLVSIKKLLASFNVAESQSEKQAQTVMTGADEVVAEIDIDEEFLSAYGEVIDEQ